MRKQQKDRARAEHTKKMAISQRGLEECVFFATVYSRCFSQPRLMSYQVPQRGEEKAIPQDGAGGGAEKVERKQCKRLMLHLVLCFKHGHKIQSFLNMISLLQGCRFCVLTSFSFFWICQKKLSASVLQMVPLDQKYAHA